MRIYHVDAFTRTRFTGNPATVVLDADGASDASLAAIAREFQSPETAFVLAANRADHDLRLRVFGARGEKAGADHATIAAHAALAAAGRRGTGACRQLSGGGVIEVRVDEPGGHVEFRQPMADLAPPLPFKSTMRVAEALSLPATQLHEVMPARIANQGCGSRLLIPVRAARALDGLAPHLDSLEGLGSELKVGGFFVFALEFGAAGLSTVSRLFCPALGVTEIPVSGNAHAMLAAYLAALGLLDVSLPDFVGHQGRHVSRPGEVTVRLEFVDGEPHAAHIGGDAVIVSEGRLETASA